MDKNKIYGFLILAALTGLIWLLQPILPPFLLGALLAYLGNPLVGHLQSKLGLGRTLAVVIVFLVLSLLGILALFLAIPVLSHQIQTLILKVPVFLQWIQETVFPWLKTHWALDLTDIDLATVKTAVVESWEKMGNIAAQVLARVTTSGLVLLAFLGNMALVPVVSFYLLKDWDVIVARIRRLLPRQSEPVIVRLTKECNEVVAAFFRGQLLVMLALGVIYSLGLWLVDTPFALLIGMLAGLVNIVPYLGFALGLMASLVAAFVEFQDWLHPALVCIVFGVGQAMEGMVLTPLLVGDRISLHPVAVIFAVLAGAQLFGFVGMLLALPVAAIIVVLLRYAHEKYMDSHFYSASKHSGGT